MRRDRILVNSHTGRNECSESLAEVLCSIYGYYPFSVNVEVALSCTYKEYMSIMIDDFRFDQGRKCCSVVVGRVASRTRVKNDKFTAVMFHIFLYLVQVYTELIYIPGRTSVVTYY